MLITVKARRVNTILTQDLLESVAKQDYHQ